MANQAAVCANASPRPLRACQACAKRRTRCDQKQPCHRCEQTKIECVRKEPERLTKSQLRRERARLQAKHEAAYVIFDALASRKQSDQILHLLRRDEPIHEIARRLMASREAGIDESSTGSNSIDHQGDLTGDTLSSTSPSRTVLASSTGEWTSNSPSNLEQPPPRLHLEDVFDTHMGPIELPLEPPLTLGTPPVPSYFPILPEHQTYDELTPATNHLDRPTAVPSPTTMRFPDTAFSATDAFAFATMPPCSSPCGSDTLKLITLPSKLVLDLTDAFFTWHAAPFPAIQRSRFVGDFLNQRTDHCSPALLRIVSCLGCRALGGYDPSRSTYASLGNRLFEESRRLLIGAPVCAPDVHACGLLALHQLGIGRYEDGAELAEEGVRRIVSMTKSGRSLDIEVAESLEYQSALCSAVTLARFVHLMLSYLTEYDPSVTSRSIQDRSQEADDGLGALLCLRGPLPTGLSSPLPACSLIELVYRHVVRAQSPELDTAHKATHLSATHQECLTWLRTALGPESQQSELCPFSHMLYHFCLLTLWRPFCPSSAVLGTVPTAACTESAGAILLFAGSSGIRDHRAPRQFFLAHLMVLAASLSGVTGGAS